MKKTCLPASLLTLVLAALACGQPFRDTQPDTWVATDALGRTLPGAEQVGAPRPDRHVGIFYFLWMRSEEKLGPFDVSRILANDPEALKKNTSPPWGPETVFHHWGESLFGYYLNDDEWVCRKHAQMLTDAGVDVILFDVSNKLTYEHNYRMLFKVWSQMRREGNRTPDVAFLTPFWDPASTVKELWEDLYSKGLHKELWYQWEGKPLILADPAKVDPEVREFFTFRRPQPDYFQGPIAADMWSWLEVHPQHMFRNSRGENEQMSVGVAQNAVKGRLGSMSEPGAHGRSFHKGKPAIEPGSVDRGLNFAEQFEHALTLDPKFIFVTGWNEWIAGRWPEFGGVKQPPHFVDQYDHEHSRDIEPMKGGHGDNYYYQLASYVRRFKGVRKPPAASAAKTIAINGEFAQWADVGPGYMDDVYDTAHRDHPGYAAATRYVDVTGRNDIDVVKVARDGENLYFYARTREPLTAATDPQWMTLFLNTDRDAKTGWQGYDYVVNLAVKDDKRTTVQRTRNGWNWEWVADLPIRAAGTELMVSVPLKAVGLAADFESFEFKWADNCRPEGDANAFTTTGDAAPNGRFNYLYRTR